MPTDLPNERTLKTPGTVELDPSSGERVARDETVRLIAASKVEGTPVYDRAGARLGAVHDLMLDKVSGQVAYAVLSFGGFLGIGEDHHPLPWNALTYSVELGGYVVDIDRETLDGAPTQGPGEDPFSDPAYGERLKGHYGGRKAPAL